MSQTNRVCICCGKEFYYCPRCGKSAKNTGISMNYDTNECAALSNAISGYTMKLWGKEKVKEILDKYNITDYTKYKQSIQDKLNELFPEQKRGIRARLNFYDEASYIPETKEEIMQEIYTIQDEQNENETPKEVRPQRKRKSRKKKVVLSDEIERIQSDEGDNL